MNNESVIKTQSVNPIVSPTIETKTAIPDVSGFSFSSISWTGWILIILSLCFLGFNIFVYLAQGTQLLTNVTAYLAGIFGNITKQTVNVSAVGANSIVNTTAKSINTGIDTLQKTGSELHSTSIIQQVNNEKVELNNALNKAMSEQQGGYSADDSTSSIQLSKSSGKSGWCFIGEDRGFRGCIQVGENDTCMSGNIFPSQEICMNPELRK